MTACSKLADLEKNRTLRVLAGPAEVASGQAVRLSPSVVAPVRRSISRRFIVNSSFIFWLERLVPAGAPGRKAWVFHPPFAVPSFQPGCHPDHRRSTGACD